MHINNYSQVRVLPEQGIRGEVKERRLRALWGAALLVIGAVATTFLAAQSPQWREGAVLVQPRPGVTDAALSQIIARYGGRSERRLGGLNR